MKARAFVRQLGKEVVNDGVTDLGAMMAYYSLLALFPMLVFVISLSMLVLDPETIRQGADMALNAAPPAAREVIEPRVNGFIEASHTGFAIAGALLALWGASRGAVAMMTALNTIHQKKETRSWIKRQAIAIGVTVAVAVFIVIALGLLFVGPFVGHYVADYVGLGDTFDLVWGIGRWVGAGLLVMFVWAIVYKFLADTNAPFRVFTPGAICGVLVWLGLSAGFSVYLQHFNSYEKTYGTLGGVIIFLTWLWLSNVTMLFGAEINDVLADFRAHKSTAAAQLSHATRRKDDGSARHGTGTPATT
ncbi:MAG TPA: YihY/virulence factor BrkB family protein [Kofleriaceae bacterium]|nr:YihY/virulence factor BrkB family protein [Kofleriaceae bacterium]